MEHLISALLIRTSNIWQRKMDLYMDCIAATFILYLSLLLSVSLALSFTPFFAYSVVVLRYNAFLCFIYFGLFMWRKT